MPLYEYRCEKCGYEMEALRKLSDPPLLDCPECAQPTLKKLVSAAAFRLKGSGWYETDFKGDKKKNLHESGEKKAGEKSKDTKKDTKKDAKKDKSGGEKKSAAKPKAAAAG